MNLSDVLTLVTILIAVAALLREDSRDLILLKFQRWHVVVIIVNVFFIHFLIGYSWFRQIIPLLQYFEIDNGPHPKTWAYAITLFLLGGVAWILIRVPITLAKIEQVRSIYIGYLVRSEWTVLIRAIRKYHLSDVVKYLNEINSIFLNIESKDIEKTDQAERMIELDKNRENAKKEIKKIETIPSFAYAKMLYNTILTDKRFIAAVADIDPLLFSDIIRNIKTYGSANKSFVQSFYKRLLVTNNIHFKEELKNTRTLGHVHYSRIETPILDSLIDDLNVVITNNIWKAFGDAAEDEIGKSLKDSSTILSSAPVLNNDEDDEIWDTVTKKTITFFDIIVRKAIETKANNHFHIYYCLDILRELNKPTVLLYGPSNTRAVRLFHETRNMISGWVKLLDVYPESQVFDEVFENFMNVQKELISNSLEPEIAVKHLNYTWGTIAELHNKASKAELSKVQNTYIESMRTQILALERGSRDWNRWSGVITMFWEKLDRPLYYGATMYGPFVLAFEHRIVSIFMFKNN